ncbi:titin-like isoform X6 [Ostrea edulis]|uniref:titin-like isoform X6 n=1 Tax=Ostrea edulis TaxID=37623 RepID=UPI0024AF969A|nr:titin-like isoform X6 [Ostrea edulis]
MMASQFDSLLDFGDSSTVDSKSTNNQMTDDFDPFSTPSPLDAKGGSGMDLLGEFNFDAQFSSTQNPPSNGHGVSVNSSSDLNPLYALSMQQDNMEETEPVNPLYDMNSVPEVQKGDLMMSSGSSNPMYDFLSTEGTNGHTNSNDLLGIESSNQADLLGSETNHVNGSVEVDASVTQSEGLDGQNQNGGETIDDFDLLGGNVERTPAVDEFPPKIEAIEDLEQESGSVEQEGGSSTSGELLVDSDVPNTRLVPEEDLLGETSAQSQEPEDLLGGAVEPQVMEENNVEEAVKETVEQEEQLLVETMTPAEEGPSMTNDMDQGESLTNQGGPELGELLGDFSQNAEKTEQEMAPEEDQKTVEVPQEIVEAPQEIVEVEQDRVEAPQKTVEVPQEIVEAPQEIPEETVDVQQQIDDVQQLETATDQKEELQQEETATEQKEEEIAPPQPEEEVEEPAPTEDVSQQFVQDEKVEVDENMSSQSKDPLQSDSLVQPLVEELAITRSPSSSEGEIEQVTYKSSTVLVLSPSSKPIEGRQFTYDTSLEEDKGPKGQRITRTKEEETRVEESGAGQKTTQTTKTTTVVQNGDISNGPEGIDEDNKAKKPTVQEEIMSVEGGVYENEPVRDPEVVRESDPKNIGEELPEIGTAKSMLQKYAKIQEESVKPVVGKRQATPPRGAGPAEYVSEPRTVIEKPEQKIEGGVFENQPITEEGVVKSYESVEDVKPEQGYARNVLAKFKEIESQVQNRPPPSPKKELTPDRFTKGEYVSEPRSHFETYEGKTESGVFESQPQEDKDVVKSYEHEEEVLPEQGTAKNLVSKFKEYESQSKSPSASRTKKELTPDRFTKGEYVSEPRATFEQYEGQVEAGVYESKPMERPDVVKSGDYYEEPLPEQGYAKNVISKFRDVQKGGGSPSSSPANKQKEITPPREDTFSGILESQPEERSDIVHSYDVREEELPETGTTRNLLNRFKEIQHSGSNSPVSPRLKKEFTPPPQSGIYENTPQKSLEVEQRVAESGILENTPDRRDGVAREEEPSAGTVEFPERGYAKNMVSKWKQLESEHSKSASPSPRYKEFTPPRDEPRIKSPLSPKSPAGTNSSVHPRDLPGQYQEQMEPGIYENQPTDRSDVAREEDTDWDQGLPREGTSQSLISKFRSVQEEAKKSHEVPKPISRRDSTDGTKSPKKKPKSPFVAVQLEKCAACQKTVYAMEKIEMNKNCYHRACFKCSHCNSRLTAKTFSMNEGVMYCTNHFKQLFARKGNYDEGFGRQQYKKRWQGDQPNGEQQTVPEPTA